MMRKLCLASFATLLPLAACSGTAASPEELEAYLKKIEVAEVRVSRTVTGRIGIYGEIRNAGEKTVKEVEVLVEYLDKAGKSIRQQVHYPVSSSLFGGEHLGPNASREFRLMANDAPEEWAQNVSVKITNLKF